MAEKKEAKQERYYSISKLNKWFAISSMILCVAVFGVFAQDYLREWRVFQREFRELEVEKTRQAYENAQQDLEQNQEYQTLIEDQKKASLELEGKEVLRKALQKDIDKLDSEYYSVNRRHQFAKAEYDAAKYRYEDAQDHEGLTKDIRDEFAKTQSLMKELKISAEDTKKLLDFKKEELSSFDEKINQLDKAKEALSHELDVINRMLAKIDTAHMSFGNRMADKFRDLPIVDFMNPSERIEQVVVKVDTENLNFMRVPRVDRCVTCHQGVLRKDFADADNPYKTHPNLDLFLSSGSPHPLEEFGCTSCHAGRGRGTDFVSAAHTPSSPEQAKEWEEKYGWHEFHLWEAPMHAKPHVEAGCFKCHSGETVLRGAEKLTFGLNLIERSGCYSCHTIEKYKGDPKTGPNLAKISSKTSKDWTFRWIKDPQAFRPGTWMPSFYGLSNNDDPESVQWTDQEIHAIVHYLYTESENYDMKEIPVVGHLARGEELVSSIGCFACHKGPNEDDDEDRDRQHLLSEFGPHLLGFGSKTSEKWLYHWLKDPKTYHPDTRMPNLRLTDQEAADISSYLVSLSNEEFMESSVPEINEDMMDNITHELLSLKFPAWEAEEKLKSMSLEDKLAFSGETIIRQQGCFACHNIPGFEDEKPIGVELTEEGSKSLHKFAFELSDIEHSKAAWFQTKLKHPRIFDKGKIKGPYEKSRMPKFQFSDEEIDAVVTALLGFVKTDPNLRKKPRTPKNLFVEAGQSFIRQHNCQGCHIIEGEGGAIQENIQDWLVKHQGKTEADAEALAASFSPPNLIGEGKKVQSDWLFSFLHEPTIIRPWLKVRMPTYDFNEEEINTAIKYFNFLDDEPFPFTEKIKPDLSAEEMAAGEKMYSPDYFDCFNCHIRGAKMPGGTPDRWAPNLELAKERLKAKWIIDWIKNPQKLLPGTKMPMYFDPEYFDDSGPDDILDGDEHEQIRVLRDYLLVLPKAANPSSPSDQDG
ncbi:c-type cytochrome [PVC group bacterium]|nr:c-type cytochrome [PVC group bacterium]